MQNPLQWWRDRIDKRREARFTALFTEADLSGAGADEAWAEPGTMPIEFAEWFDEFMGDSPHVLACNIPEIEVFVVFAGRMDEATWERGPDGIELPGEDILFNWQGTRTEWWREARDRCIAAIPPDHVGVYVCGNSAGRILASLRGRPTTHSARAIAQQESNNPGGIS